MLACAGWLYASAPALAAGYASDVVSTRAYLRASMLSARRAHAEVSARIAVLEARTSEIASECPSALTYAPRDTAFGELVEAAETTVAYADVAPVRAAMLRLAHSIAHLSWSNRRLTRLVRSQAVGERMIATLALPDICAGIETWRASAYATPPATVTEFLMRVRPVESGVGPSEEPLEMVILRLLKPYEDAAERRSVKRMERLEEGANRRLVAAIAAAQKRLAVVLGVSGP